ncbi:DUF885 family protein [Luteibacter sp. PPL201]|uniref:DUF885 family protein n=1 Tax=Luteibacter sahnii TaxID=3021977 RepID=A0ABT6BC12_9GAMM
MTLSHALRHALLLGLLAAPAAYAAGHPVADFDALVAQRWDYQLKESPELATTIGDDRYNDRWTDYSLAHVEVDRVATEAMLKRFEAVDGSRLDEQRQISLQMSLRELRDHLASIRLKNQEMVLDQIGGAHLALPGFVSTIPFDSTKHYDDYVKRLKAVPAVIDQLIAVSRQGMADRLMQPRYLLEKVATQAHDIATPEGLANVFGEPATRIPASVPAADQARLRQAIVEAVDHDVRPAYEKLARFVATEYAPHGRRDEGLWALPDGDARYRFAIHTQTTTDLDARRIHQIGLDEVKRIESEMTAIAKRLGYAGLPELRAAIANDPKRYATSREQILDAYRGFIAGMQPALPTLFGHLPTTALRVQPVERYREKDAAGAEYHQGTPDGSRPGIVFVNTGDYAQRALYAIEDTAYHEGVPGHHLQISIAQSLPLPPFRQQAGYNAYIEGWALYAERLAKDAGFYTDPYNDYGRLVGDLLRADRLVLDTGVHALHWNRQQMIDFFHAHPAEDEPSMQAETDRYIAWPGQALGYKLGQLTFLKLRERAKQALGDRFDIRAFHDEVLSGGAMPLELLEQRTDAWIARHQAARS